MPASFTKSDGGAAFSLVRGSHRARERTVDSYEICGFSAAEGRTKENAFAAVWKIPYMHESLRFPWASVRLLGWARGLMWGACCAAETLDEEGRGGRLDEWRYALGLDPAPALLESLRGAPAATPF